MLRNSLNIASNPRSSASLANAKVSSVSVVSEPKLWLWAFLYIVLSIQTPKTLITASVLILIAIPPLVPGLLQPLARQQLCNTVGDRQGIIMYLTKLHANVS